MLANKLVLLLSVPFVALAKRGTRSFSATIVRPPTPLPSTVSGGGSPTAKSAVLQRGEGTFTGRGGEGNNIYKLVCLFVCMCACKQACLLAFLPMTPDRVIRTANFSVCDFGTHRCLRSIKAGSGCQGRQGGQMGREFALSENLSHRVRIEFPFHG
jgi:hypothetical protein